MDSYSQFRVSLALDRQLDADLRNEMQRRVDSLSTNPLESSPANEMSAALKRYALLQDESLGDASRLVKRIDHQRREELAAFGATPARQSFDIALHAMSLGIYTRRAKRDHENLALLSSYRRIQNNLDFLDKLVAADTPPEVAYPEDRIRAAVAELSSLMPAIRSPQMREHAQTTLDRLGKIPMDDVLRSECSLAAENIAATRKLTPVGVPGVLAASPAVPLR